MKKNPDQIERNYEVYRDGRLMERRPVELRYPRETELILLGAGYTIKINGKRITKKELKNG